MRRAFVYTISFIFIVQITGIALITAFSDQLIDRFTKELTRNSPVEFSYRTISLSLWKNFPYSTFSLEEALVKYKIGSSNDTLLFCKSFGFKVNILKLIIGKYELNNISANDGVLNYIPCKFKSLVGTNSSVATGSKLAFSIKHATIANFMVNYNSVETGESAKISIKKARITATSNNVIRLNYRVKMLSISISSHDFRHRFDKELSIRGDLVKNGIIVESPRTNISIGSIPFSLAFTLNLEKETASVWGKSESLNIREFISQLGISNSVGALDGNLILNISANFSDKSFSKKEINIGVELSKTKILIDNNNLYINYLKGNTLITNSFDKALTTINQYKIRYNSIGFEGNAKIKGVTKPIILVETNLNATRAPIKIGDFLVDASFKGYLKALLELDKLGDSYKYKLHRIQPSVNFTLHSVSGLSDFEGFHGLLTTSTNTLNISGRGLFQGSAFDARLAIPNLLEVANGNAHVCPTASISANYFNYDRFEFKMPTSSDSSSTDFVLSTAINELVYDGYSYRDAKFRISSTNGSLRVPEFSFSGFAGSVKGWLTLEPNRQLNLNANIAKVDISQFFMANKDWGQTVITHRNLNGLLSGKIYLVANLDANYNPIIPSLRMESEITIDNGSLTGMEQFKSLSRILNLDEVASINFNKLTNSILISNSRVFFPAMNINSNVLNFNISGEHGFDGGYTYWLKVNLGQVLARKFLSKENSITEYQKDSNGNFNLFFKIVGDTTDFKITMERNQTIERIKVGIQAEGKLLKQILKDEFSKNRASDSSNNEKQNKLDTLHNNKIKKPFRIEWDEIDSLNTEHN
jgi:hypothetical protein